MEAMADERPVCPCCNRVLWEWPEPKAAPEQKRFPLEMLVPEWDLERFPYRAYPRRKWFESIQYDGFRTLVREWNEMQKTTDRKGREWEVLCKMHRCLSAIITNPRGKS